MKDPPPIPPAAAAWIRHVLSTRLPWETDEECFDRWFRENTPSGFKKLPEGPMT